MATCLLRSAWATPPQHDALDLVVYVNDLFDEIALLSFDRERGGRARTGFAIGQPRTFGATVRKAF